MPRVVTLVSRLSSTCLSPLRRLMLALGCSKCQGNSQIGFFPRLFSLVVVEESRGDEERPVRPTCLADSHYHHCDDRSGSCAELFKVSAVKNISNAFVQYSHLDPATLFYVTLSPSSKRRFLFKRGSTRSTLSPTRPHRTCFFMQ